MFDAQEDELKEAYENLMFSGTLLDSCNFLKHCYLLEEGYQFKVAQFAKMLYTTGNLDEVYTKAERDFISEFDQEVGTISFFKQARDKTILCRIILVRLSEEDESIYKCIAFMKIFNKAFDGFNIFHFVDASGVYFGSSCIQSKTTDADCLISPCLTRQCDWSAIYSTLIERDITNDFYNYYSGVVNLIISLKDCVFRNDNDKERLQYPHFSTTDDEVDAVDRVSGIITRKGLHYFLSIEQDLNIPDDADLDASRTFESDVDYCMHALSFIKTNRMNPMEMLFNAEEAYVKSHSAEGHLESSGIDGHPDNSEGIDSNMLEMLSDPIVLVKNLKKIRGI